MIALRSFHAAKYSRCSVYAASAWKTKIRDAYDEWWRCRRPADPLPLNILTLFVWIPLFGLVRSHHVVVSSLLLLMEKILSKILPLGYSRKFFVSDQFFRFSSIFRSIFSSIRFFFSLIRFLINSKSNKCKLSAVLQKIILGWIQRKKMNFLETDFEYLFSLCQVKNGRFGQKWPFSDKKWPFSDNFHDKDGYRKMIFCHSLKSFKSLGIHPILYTVWLSYSRSKGHTASHFSVDSTRFNTF